MSEASLDTPSTPPRHTARNCGLGCLGLLLLLVVGGGVAASSANRRLDARVQAVTSRIQALNEAAARPRPTLLGPSQDEADAGADYNGLQWALARGDTASLPKSWAQQRPALPASIEAVVAKIGGEGQIDYAALVGFDDHLDPRLRTPLSAKSVAELERFLPATAYVRSGVTRSRCDWQTRWERGWELEVPSLLLLRFGAYLLAYEATTLPPREALETGLVILAYSEDVALQGTLIGTMMAIKIREIGVRSLAHSMSRPGLKVADYQRVLDVVARLRWSPPAELIRRESLGGEVTILAVGGRQIDLGRGSAADGPSDFELPAAARAFASLSFFQERELSGYTEFLERAARVEELPRDQRGAAWEELGRDLEGSTSLFARLATPNFGGLWIKINETHARCDAARVLAAAHLARLSTGAFPPTLEALGSALGELPEDPHREGQPLGYLLKGDLLLVYSVGENGVDDQAATGSDDQVLATQAPRAE